MKKSRDIDRLVSKVHQVAFHRNGVGGEGFHALVFDSSSDECAKCHGFATLGENLKGDTVCSECGPTERAERLTKMAGIVFDGPGRVAVLDVVKLVDPSVGVAFGENSWRGDQFEGGLRSAIESEDSDGSVRIGPFALPTKRSKR